jgi:type I restriction enzyme M protein
MQEGPSQQEPILALRRSCGRLPIGYAATWTPPTIRRNKRNGKFRDRRRQTLVVDARKIGHLVERVQRELSEEEIARIAGTYHAWRGEPANDVYQDIPGFCQSATTEEIASYGYVLTPGRYVSAGEIQDDGEPFQEKMARPTVKLEEQFLESARLEAAMKERS